MQLLASRLRNVAMASVTTDTARAMTWSTTGQVKGAPLTVMGPSSLLVSFATPM
jgi:hypothetical protein